MTGTFTESVVEDAALEWLGELGQDFAHGPTIAPEEPNAEHDSYDTVILEASFRDALARLNSDVRAEALDETFRKVDLISSPVVVDANHEVHHYLFNGVSVEYLRKDGMLSYDPVRIIEFDAPDNNGWIAVNQLTVIAAGHNRRPDIVLFLNGLPLVVVELKNAADENATVWSAFNQLPTDKHQIPSLFRFNEALMVSDGLHGRLGTLTANKW
jgi:type I restriction enzyme R subunit